MWLAGGNLRATVLFSESKEATDKLYAAGQLWGPREWDGEGMHQWSTPGCPGDCPDRNLVSVRPKNDSPSQVGRLHSPTASANHQTDTITEHIAATSSTAVHTVWTCWKQMPSARGNALSVHGDHLLSHEGEQLTTLPSSCPDTAHAHGSRQWSRWNGGGGHTLVLFQTDT